MRLSVDNRPGFKRVTPGLYAVTMDGRVLERCLAVDTGAGVAWVHELDAQGNVVVDRQKLEIREQRVLGPVRLQRIEDQDHG